MRANDEHFQKAVLNVAARNGTERKPENSGNTELFPVNVAVCWSVQDFKLPLLGAFRTFLRKPLLGFRNFPPNSVESGGRSEAGPEPTT